jgi:hypothetical protein
MTPALKVLGAYQATLMKRPGSDRSSRVAVR